MALHPSRAKVTMSTPVMESNANAFKCILNIFQKYLHFRFSNEKYVHLH